MRVADIVVKKPVSVRLPQEFTRDWVELFRLPHLSRGDMLELDFSQTTRIDSAGASLIMLLRKKCKLADAALALVNCSEHIAADLKTWQGMEAAYEIKTDSVRRGFFLQIGDSAHAFYEALVAVLSIITEMFYWGSLGLFSRRDIKKGALGEQMFQLGFKAIGIVGLLALLIGVVLALQTAIQLRTYGAGIFLAPMIGISMIRELGPLMTAIILAGRSGSATTAEIATMAVGEELDALQTMGINPVQFVVVPKMWAISITMPLLTVFAMVTGILGGYLVAVFYLGLASNLFLGELIRSMHSQDVLISLLKSMVFAWLIIGIGAFYGFRVRGGAEAVGRETTASVVTCIFVIILADAAFSFIF